MTQQLSSVALVQAEQRCLNTDWEVGQGQLAEEKNRVNCSLLFTAAPAFNPESSRGSSGRDHPRSTISHLPVRQSAGLTNARWARSFVNVLVFSEAQQWCRSFTEQLGLQSGFPCVSCPLKHLCRFFLQFDCESCNCLGMAVLISISIFHSGVSSEHS